MAAAIKVKCDQIRSRSAHVDSDLFVSMFATLSITNDTHFCWTSEYNGQKEAFRGVCMLNYTVLNSLISLVEYYKWEKFAYLYDSDRGKHFLSLSWEMSAFFSHPWRFQSYLHTHLNTHTLGHSINSPITLWWNASWRKSMWVGSAYR